MHSLLRNSRRLYKKLLLAFLICMIVIQIRSPSLYYLSSKFVKLKAQFAPLSDYVPILDMFSQLNISMVALDPNLLSNDGDVNTQFVTFGIFEDDVHQLKKIQLQNLLPYFWTMREHRQVDFRVLNKIRRRRNVTAHFSFTSSYVGTLHVAIIFSRSNYFWISEFADHNFQNLTLSLSLPIAVERFTCETIQASDYHHFCIPNNRSHYLWQLPRANFLECHYEDVVWRFEREYQLEQVDTVPHAASLQEMMRIGSKFQVPIMLAYGSLLGWYRQCDYIVHSKDIDTKMFIHDFSYELFRELWNSQILRPYVRLGSVEEGLEFRSFGASTVWFDLFMMYPQGDTYFTYMIHTVLYELHRSTYPMPKRICTAELLGVLVHLPCEPLKYIEAEYGPDNWFAPRPTHYNNVEVIRKYNDVNDTNSNMHMYIERCDDPSILWGCDKADINEFNTIDNKLST